MGRSGSEPIGCQLRFALAVISRVYSITRTAHLLTHSCAPAHPLACAPCLPTYSYDPSTYILAWLLHSLARAGHSFTHSYDLLIRSPTRPTHSFGRATHPLTHSYHLSIRLFVQLSHPPARTAHPLTRSYKPPTYSLVWPTGGASLGLFSRVTQGTSRSAASWDLDPDPRVAVFRQILSLVTHSRGIPHPRLAYLPSQGFELFTYSQRP